MRPLPALVLAGFALGPLAACGIVDADSQELVSGPVAVVSVAREPFQVIVRAVGELEAPNASPIAVPPVPTGALKVKEVIAEGSMVEKGEVILVFDDTQLSIDLANHTATFRSTERKLDKNRIDWRIDSGSIETMKNVAELERDFATEYELDDDYLYSEREILESVLDKRFAEEKIIFADGKFLLRGEFFDIDARILGVEKDQVKGKIDRVETSLGKLVLQAPIGGMIVYKKRWNGSTVSVGDTLWPGNMVLSIVDPTETILKVDVLEKDAPGVEVGARAFVRIDARADREFTGEVSEISKLSRPIERGSPVKYFQVKIALDGGDPDLLKPGMKGEARIVVADLDDVVVVPRSAIHGTEGDYRVLVDGPEGAEARPVELGQGDVVRVSVTSGLDGDERIVLGADPESPDTGIAGAGSATEPSAVQGG